MLSATISLSKGSIFESFTKFFITGGFMLETNRLILRPFELSDIEALYTLLKDKEVNTFLPWFPVKNIDETIAFYETRFRNKKYHFAICLKKDNYPIGYIKVATDDSYDFGYALLQEHWHNGYITEAAKKLIEQLKEDNIPYITATHDKNNTRSGEVMKRVGMKYCYSYVEQWQPKNFLVTFRMYQLNFNGIDNFVYKKYWDMFGNHFIENIHY